MLEPDAPFALRLQGILISEWLGGLCMRMGQSCLDEGRCTVSARMSGPCMQSCSNAHACVARAMRPACEAAGPCPCGGAHACD